MSNTGRHNQAYCLSHEPKPPSHLVEHYGVTICYIIVYIVITLLYLYHFYPTFQSIEMLQYQCSRSEFTLVPIASSPWVESCTISSYYIKV